MVRFEEEIRGGDRNLSTREEFNNHLHLIDFPINDYLFTWSYMRKTPYLPKQEKNSNL